MAKFDWTKHTHDRLGDMLIRLVSLKDGKSLEEYGLIGPDGAKHVTDIDIRITVNGHEISFDDFVEQCYTVDNQMLQAAAKDVVMQRFGEKFDRIEELLRTARSALEDDAIDSLRPEWDRVVQEGPAAEGGRT